LWILESTNTRYKDAQVTNIEVGRFRKTHLAKLYNALDEAIKDYAKVHHATYAEIFGVIDILKLDMYRDLITEDSQEDQ